jgi:hypothetical protein
MQQKTVLLYLFLFLHFFADAQGGKRSFFIKKKQPYKCEVIGSLGAANFLGDLGGANQIGTHGAKDLNLNLTRPTVGIGARITALEMITVKGNFYWAAIRGDDRLTQEHFRHLRNLNFKSNIFELSGQVEFNFMKGQKGHVYQIKGIRGIKHKDKNVYLFAGGGLVHFNPKGLYNGKWYELQPIGTEGQGMIPGMKRYHRTAGVISLGAGMRFAINRFWGLGFEIGLRRSFSDYMDDVSTVYPDKNIFNNNPLAIALSNPMQVTNPSEQYKGEQRGNPASKDAYMFASFTVGYKVIHKKRSRSKF